MRFEAGNVVLNTSSLCSPPFYQRLGAALLNPLLQMKASGIRQGTCGVVCDFKRRVYACSVFDVRRDEGDMGTRLDGPALALPAVVSPSLILFSLSASHLVAFTFLLLFGCCVVQNNDISQRRAADRRP